MSDNNSASENYAGVWDGKVGFGARPALILIDFLQAYTTAGAPLYASAVTKAVRCTVPLLDEARRRSIPLVHTNIRYMAGGCADGGWWVRKAPVMKSMVAGNPLAEFCPDVAPREGEPVVTKQYASAFFGTSLAAMLTTWRIDTVVLVGCSTSGCIRASAVDAVQHGFRTIVVRQCVGDRHPAPHEANLFDINSKYGDVVDVEEALTHFQTAVVDGA